MADISKPAISPPKDPWKSSLGDVMSRDHAIISPDTTPTNAKMIHISTSIYLLPDRTEPKNPLAIAIASPKPLSITSLIQ